MRRPRPILFDDDLDFSLMDTGQEFGVEEILKAPWMYQDRLIGEKFHE
jgi:hypothetical protein